MLNTSTSDSSGIILFSSSNVYTIFHIQAFWKSEAFDAMLGITPTVTIIDVSAVYVKINIWGLLCWPFRTKNSETNVGM